MKKLFACIVSLFLILIPTQVWAHSTLTESIPAIDAVVKEDVKALQLTFDTEILEGSTFTLKDKAGQEIALHGVQIDGAALKGTTTDPLPNGKITVDWSIIGADGHLIQGNYQFTVQNEKMASNEDSSNTGTPDASKDKAPSESSSVNNDSTAATEAPASTEGQSTTSKPLNGDSLLLPIIVVVLGIAVIVFFFIMKKKDDNS